MKIIKYINDKCMHCIYHTGEYIYVIIRYFLVITLTYVQIYIHKTITYLIINRTKLDVDSG